MSSPEELQPGFARSSPEVRIAMEDGEKELVMTWENTLLRYYAEGEGMFDHVAHKRSDGSYIVFKVTPALHERLLAENFPMRRDPVVDTMGIAAATAELDSELEELGREP